jgi:hypothetical protein
MESIFDIDINAEFHPSQFPLDHVRSFSVYIPTLEQCIPSENHYFGIEEFPNGSLFVEQETGRLMMPLRMFFKSLLNGNPYAYEVACTPTQYVTNYTQLGNEVLSFAIENFATKALTEKYEQLFILHKSSSVRYYKAIRYFAELKRLYSGLNTVEMNEKEQELYYAAQINGINKKNVTLLLAHMDFELQELATKATFPQIDLNYVNQFLIRIHKSYLRVED